MWNSTHIHTSHTQLIQYQSWTSQLVLVNDHILLTEVIHLNLLLTLLGTKVIHLKNKNTKRPTTFKPTWYEPLGRTHGWKMAAKGGCSWANIHMDIQNDTNPRVEFILQNKLERGRCPRTNIHMTKPKLNWCGTLRIITYHHALQSTSAETLILR